MTTKTRVLAIDFGLKRIGLAISDMLRMIASPLENLEAMPSLEKTAERLALHLEKLKKDRGYIVGEIVMGLPLLMNGQESERSKAVREFATLLEAKLTIPVHLLDERLSTVQAERALIETGFTRKKRAEFVDRVSASVLLQTYLNQKGPQ